MSSASAHRLMVFRTAELPRFWLNKAFRVLSFRLMPGERMASSSTDRIVRIWNVLTGAVIAQLNNVALGAIAVLPKEQVAVAARDKTIAIWNGRRIRSYDELARLRGLEAYTTALAALPGGLLASGFSGSKANDVSIAVWDLESAEPVLCVPGLGDVSCLILLSDGRLASSSMDRVIRMLEFGSGTETARLEIDSWRVEDMLEIEPELLGTACFDGVVRVFNTVTTKELWRADIGAKVRCLSVAPGGLLAGGAEDKTIRLWHPSSGVELDRLEFDAPICSLAPPLKGLLVAADTEGRVYWMKPLAGH